MANNFIFVYGTLRKQAATRQHQLMERYCQYFSDAYIYGKLYEINGYPGVIESSYKNDKVYGEIYRIINPPQLLPRLDAYEECTPQFPAPHEYIRTRLPVILPLNNTITAWVYLYNRAVTNLMRIKSGDYCNTRYKPYISKHSE